MKTLRTLCTGALSALVCLTSAAVLPLAAASPASAGLTPPPSCVPEEGFQHCMLFAATGSDQTFEVPAGVTSVKAQLWGAGGGGTTEVNAGESSGGAGGFTGGLIPVTLGQALTLTVGSGGLSGGSESAYGGGGMAGTVLDNAVAVGGSGGGMSAIWNGESPLLIAGGGGGTGGTLGEMPNNGAGGGGGLSTAANGPVESFGGGGDQGSGGAAASDFSDGCSSAAADGAQFFGGNGGAASFESNGAGGGGGGGGYFGGGGGACEVAPVAGGGGGGSAFIAESVSQSLTLAGVSGQYSTRAQAYLANGNPRWDLTASGGLQGSPGGDGAIMLEWNVPPAPVPATTFGTGPAPQSTTVALETGDSVMLLGPEEVLTTSVDVEGGAYSLDPQTAVITFTPTSTFFGTPTPITFRVTNDVNLTGDATYTPTVNVPDVPAPSGLTSEDTGTDVQSTTVTIPPGDVLSLFGTSATTVSAVDQGDYSLDPQSGIITFTPVLGFSGQADGITYQLTDNYGGTGTAGYTPTVDKPAAPTALPLLSTGTGTAFQSASVDMPAGGTLTLLDSDGNPVAPLAIPGQGTYVVTETGLRFLPAFGFSGTAGPASYRVTDSYQQSSTSTYTATVGKPVGPSAPTLTSSGLAGVVQSRTVDLPIGGQLALRSAGQSVSTMTVPGQGTFSVTSNLPGLQPHMVRRTGTLTFTPDADFAGAATPATFRVTDGYGQSADARYTPTVVANSVVSVAAPASVVLRSDSRTIPVTCKLSAGRINRCDVELTVRINGVTRVLGAGSMAGGGVTGPLVVPVRLNALGSFLASVIGGEHAAVSANVVQAGNPLELHAATTTRIVDADVKAANATYFANNSATLLPSEKVYLDTLRTRLDGVRSITCVGNTDVTGNPVLNARLATARAGVVCRYLTRGTSISSSLRINTQNAAPGAHATEAARRQNRRTDITFGY